MFADTKEATDADHNGLDAALLIGEQIVD